MASVNKVIIVGHLGRDPEVRYLSDGNAVANVSIATSERWKDKATGEQKEATEWHRVNFFSRLAEIAGEYLKKGSLVYVEGALRTRSYDKDGQTHYVTEIRADTMKMLGGRPEGGEGNDTRQQPQRQQPPQRNEYADARGRSQPQGRASKPASGFDDMDGDIPF